MIEIAESSAASAKPAARPTRFPPWQGIMVDIVD
jgi:hypothetical protein